MLKLTPHQSDNNRKGYFTVSFAVCCDVQAHRFFVSRPLSGSLNPPRRPAALHARARNELSGEWQTRGNLETAVGN